MPEELETKEILGAVLDKVIMTVVKAMAVVFTVVPEVVLLRMVLRVMFRLVLVVMAVLVNYLLVLKPMVLTQVMLHPREVTGAILPEVEGVVLAPLPVLGRAV